MPHDLTTEERGCLAHGLAALDPHTQAPLRLVGHASSPHHQVFEMREEFELGARGRRYLISVDRRAHEALLVHAGDRREDPS